MISDLLVALRVPKERRKAVGGKMYVGAMMAVMRHAPPRVEVDFGDETDEEIDAGLAQLAVYLKDNQKAERVAREYFQRMTDPMRPHLTEKQQEKLDAALAA